MHRTGYSSGGRPLHGGGFVEPPASLPAPRPLLQSGRRLTGGAIWLIAFITVSSAGRSASTRGA